MPCLKKWIKSGGEKKQKTNTELLILKKGISIPQNRKSVALQVILTDFPHKSMCSSSLLNY